MVTDSDSVGEMSRRGKGKARVQELEDGPSSFPLFSTYCGAKGVTDDGDVGDGGGGGEEVVDTKEEELQDPLGLLGSEIMMMILSKLDARSVALTRSVSRDWLAVASCDRIWGPKEKEKKKGLDGVVCKDGSIMISHMCEELWQGKAHIPQVSKVQGLPKWNAYALSVLDSKRTRITRQDLCDHVWEFHFTEAAPEYWRNLDPYWNGGGAPLRRYFHPDGSISADPDDPVWGGHESCYTVVTGLLVEDEEDVREHYVRINRWPKLWVRRRIQDWRWELSNNLCCYTSLPP